MLFPVHFGGSQLSGLGDAASTIAAAIQTQEGYYPGTIAYTNNNPGNLICANQTGGIGCNKGFEVFPDYATGDQALLAQIQNYANRGLTINQMMAIYAPATDANGNPIPGNNPTLYAQNIANVLGVDPNTPLTTALASSPGSTGTIADTLDASVDGSDTSGDVDWGTIALVGLGAVAVMYALG